MPPKSATSSPKAGKQSPRAAQPTTGLNGQQARQGSYEPNVTPIVFYVQRMHREIEAREREQQLVPRQARPTPRPKKKDGVSFKGFVARVILFYVLIAYYLVCPTDSSRERAVCRGLDSFQARLAAFEPHVRPYVDTAQRKIQPYVAQFEAASKPYVDQVKPYLDRTDAVLRPQVDRVTHIYNNQVHPRLIKGISASQHATKPYVASVKQQYQKSLAPSVDWYGKAGQQWYKQNAEPYLSVVEKNSRQYVNAVQDTLQPVYDQGYPFVRKHWRETVVPVSVATYSTLHHNYVHQVHPRAVTLGGHAHVFYKTRILPALQRFYSLFIAPQLDKISERIFEYRTKKSRAEAVAHVDKVEQEVLSEQDTDNLEDFIADLRNTPDEVDTSQLPADAEVPPAAKPAAPPLSPAEQQAANADKRAALEALQSSYEKELTKLGQAEHDLLLARLLEIRQHAVEDVPKRFSGPLQALDDEGDKMVGRLQKTITRVQTEEKRLTPEEKVRDIEFLSKKAVIKMRKLAGDIRTEVDEYRKTAAEKETRAVQSAQEAVKALVIKAQEELGYGWTWLDDVTAKDWQRYHGLAKAEKNWKENYAGIRDGSISDASLASLKPYEQLDQVSTQAERMVSTLESILERSLSKGRKEILGEWTGVVNEAQKAYAAAGEQAASVVDAVKQSASSLAGVEPEPTNAYESVSSIASVAQASAASLAQQAYSAGAAVPVASAVASVYGEASQTVLRAAGIEPSPTDLRQSASYAAYAASRAAESAYARATEEVMARLGSTARPTNLEQTITSVAKAIESSAASALSEASAALLVNAPASVVSAVSAASGAVDAAVESGVSLGWEAASSVSSFAAPVIASLSSIAAAPVKEQLEGAVDSAATFFGEASQQVVRAVGGEPSPTDVAQSATSVLAAMRSAGASVADGLTVQAASAASVVSSYAEPHSAFSTAGVAEGVVASASSLVKEVSASAVSAASQVSSYAEPHSAFSTAGGAAGGVAASASSLAQKVSSAVHDATRTTAEGVRETVVSVASAVKSVVQERAPHVEL